MRLGFDLRGLPTDGSPGAGIEHASRELFDACVQELKESPHQVTGFFDRNIEAVIFPTGTIPIGFPRSIKTYPWVHDIAIFQHPEWFPQSSLRRLFTTWQFRHGLQRATHIFSVSQATKQDLIDQFGIDPDRITVTGQGIEVAKQAWQPDASNPYALILGTVEPRKNIPFITDLWPEVQARLKQPVRLVIAGRTGWGQVPIPAQPWLERLDHLSDPDREALLAHASVVLVPSLHEGFGRVALEALSIGTPVITSDRGALPEVVGSAGVVIPLSNRNGWIDQISQFLTAPNPSEMLARQHQSRLFSWPNTLHSFLAKILPK